MHRKGETWKENNISREEVFALNSRINEGTQKLWKLIKNRLNEAVSEGYFN